MNFFQREGKKGRSPGKMCQRKGMEWMRQGKFLCRKWRETLHIYLER